MGGVNKCGRKKRKKGRRKEGRKEERKKRRKEGKKQRNRNMSTQMAVKRWESENGKCEGREQIPLFFPLLGFDVWARRHRGPLYNLFPFFSFFLSSFRFLTLKCHLPPVLGCIQPLNATSCVLDGCVLHGNVSLWQVLVDVFDWLVHHCCSTLGACLCLCV